MAKATSRSPPTRATARPGGRIRVLLLADSCNPDWVSLPAVAFKACRAIAELADVTLVTNVRNEPAISSRGCGRARVVYIDNEAIAAPLFRMGRWLRGGDSVAWTANVALLYPAYLVFEWRVWRQFRSALAQGSFDLVHRLTPMSPTIPSPMAKWSPLPFVLGPLNGGLPWPTAYRRELHREREHLSLLRSAFRLLPFHRSTYARARVILAAFRHTLDDLPPASRGAALDFPEVGIDSALFHPPQHARPAGLLTFLFAGRLVPYKCCDVLIAAFARSPVLRRHRLVIAGEGPEQRMLAGMVATHGLSSCVEFVGWKSQAEVAQLMRSADVFAFPSIRELGAGVVVEAMASGCVPVVVDYGGPGGLVDDSTGIRLPLGPKAELVAAFSSALEALAEDRGRLARLSATGARRALAAYSWEAKARKMVEVYEWALRRRDAPPRLEDEPARALNASPPRATGPVHARGSRLAGDCPLATGGPAW